MKKQSMIYIACDPTQPGTAYAGIVDDGEHPEDISARLSEWGSDGAEIDRVSPDTARQMMCAWDREKSTLFERLSYNAVGQVR